MKKALFSLLLLTVSLTSFSRVTIPMEQEGGVYKIPCVVNGLRMKFIFDTGAANVCISESMAKFMLENEYLSKADIMGEGQSSVADGRIVDHVKIHLSSLEIGGMKLNDIEAIVISGQSAPLLLGQSAISKMGRISIAEGNLIIEEIESNCDDDTINQWYRDAERFFNAKLYSEALSYFQNINDCQGLGDYNTYLMGYCHQQLGQYKEALNIYNKIGNGNATFTDLQQAQFYLSIAICYRLISETQTSAYYCKKALEFLSVNDWRTSAEIKYHLALCYYAEKKYNDEGLTSLDGIFDILRNKYPDRYEDYKKSNDYNIERILWEYNWSNDVLLGNLLFLYHDSYFNTMGYPNCIVIKVASTLGSQIAIEARNILRSEGLCQ